MMIEVFENIFEAIIEFDLIGFLWKCVKLPFKFVVGVYKLLKQITETDLKKLLKKLDTSLVKIAYVCGNIVGFIIQLLLEALCTGGVAAVEDLIQTLFKFLRNPAGSIANGIKATINISKEFFYNLIYKLSKFFESLKSKAAYKAIDEWVEQLLAAIKKELGISDEALNKSKKYGRIYRVQGGKNAPNISKFRFILKNNRVTIEGEEMLHVTFNDEYRVAQFWAKRGKEAEVFTAEIDNAFIEKIRRCSLQVMVLV